MWNALWRKVSAHPQPKVGSLHVLIDAVSSRIAVRSDEQNQFHRKRLEKDRGEWGDLYRQARGIEAAELSVMAGHQLAMERRLIEKKARLNAEENVRLHTGVRVAIAALRRAQDGTGDRSVEEITNDLQKLLDEAPQLGKTTLYRDEQH